MNIKKLYIYSALTVIAITALSVFSIRAIRMEEDFLRHQEQLNKERELTILTEQVKLYAETTRQDVLLGLQNINFNTMENDLIRRQNKDPLIRNVFIWNDQKGLSYPRDFFRGSREKLEFINRYKALLEGKIKWQKDNEIQVIKAPNKKAAQYKIVSNALEDVSQSISERYVLNDNALQQRGQVQSYYQSPDTQNIKMESGWIPWFDGNRLYQLIWVRRGSTVYGAEIEQMNFIATLITSFPKMSENTSCKLINGSNEVFHQAGKSLSKKKNTHKFVNSLAPALPHWEIQYEFILPSHNKRVSSSSLILILLLIFIVGGIFMLIFQTRKSYIDALQKSNFVSNVSHELKTPLTSIRMYAELLAAKKEIPSDKQEKYVSVIINESQRLTRLVNNVLNFSRLDRGQHKYSFQMLRLDKLLEEIIDSQQMILQLSEIETIISCPEIEIETDRDVIEQVLINLIDNTCKYAAEGKSLEILVAQESSKTIIEILDKGPGIPEKKLKHIFTKFYQADSSLTDKAEGVGLGLSICQQLLSAMNASIRCQNRQNGTGTSFKIELNGRTK
ncbi:MAG: HAMP domain-containing histidine kinase [Lentisphaeria bacterium]|nr:HAMP domain-containing histidine kinase [Lentisphaeria bacterium]